MIYFCKIKMNLNKKKLWKNKNNAEDLQNTITK